jgi:hypothetical protein
MADNTDISSKAAGKRGSRPPAYWIFSPLVLIYAWSLYWIISFAKTFSWWTVFIAFLALLASFAGPVCRAVGLTKAASICAAMVIGLYWTLTFFLTIGFMIAGKTPLALIYFWYIFFPPIIIAIATTISLARSAGHEWALGCIGAGFAFGVLALALGPASKTRDTNWVRPLDPGDLRSEMRALSKCSQDFAVAHPEAGFPESLEQMSQESTSCFPGALLSAQQKGFTITYQPGSRNGEGRIASYSIKARETTPKGKDTSSSFTDESGLIWTRYDGPHGMGFTLPLLQGENGIARVRGCLGDAASGNAIGFASGKSTSDPQQIARHCIGEAYFVSEHKLVYYNYTYDYAFTKAEDGKVDGFTLNIRPEPYGVMGIRSFLAIETSDIPRKHYNQVVYATPQDRAATVNDPLALGSEVGLSFALAKTEN